MKTPLPPPAAPARLWTALACATLAFVTHPAGAAVTEAWVQRYTVGDYEPQGTKVVCDAAGNIIVASEVTSLTNSDMLTIKYSGTDGSVLWQKLYNGPNTAGNSWDYATGLAVDGSGNVVVTGPSYNAIYSYDYDYYTAKYAAANGALLWEKRYNGGTVSGGSSDTPRAVAVDGAGNVVVTGESGANPAPAVYHYDYYTAKYAAANGALLWERRYNGPGNSLDFASAVALDGSGNVVVSGTSNLDYYTAKYAAANGALLWEKRYNGPANRPDVARAVVVDASGNVVVTGRSNNPTNYDCYTAKYAAANGALLWEQRYNGPANRQDDARAVAVDNNGDVVVTGSSNNETNSDFYTAKYAAANGTLLWEKRYNGPGNSNDVAQAVAVDASGNVVVTGYSFNSSGNDDYYTAKYAAADGALLWEKHYNGPANGNDSARSLAFGPNGMVAIAGSSLGGSSADFATVVYWEKLPAVSVAMVAQGVRLRFTGVPDRSYTIERAPAVTGPWSILATPTAPVGGLIVHVDTNPPVGPAFYRTSAP